MEATKGDEIKPEHKEAMLEHLRLLYSKKFKWADEVLHDVLVQQHYSKIIREIDMDAYRSEVCLA